MVSDVGPQGREESVRYMLYGVRRFVADDCHYVKLGLERDVVSTYVRVGGACDARLFGLVHRLCGVGQRGGACLDLDKYYAVSPGGDDIDLKMSEPPVALHYGVSGCCQIVVGGILAPMSGDIVLGHTVLTIKARSRDCVS